VSDPVINAGTTTAAGEDSHHAAVPGAGALPDNKLRSRRWRTAALLSLLSILLVSIGLGGYSAWRSYVAYRHGRAAEQALARGDLKAAHAELDKYLEFWPRNAHRHFLAARTARRLHLYDEADDHLNRCRELGWNQDALLRERRLMRAQRGDPASVEKDLMQEVENGHPDSVLILEALAQGYMVSLWDLPSALRHLNKWLELDPKAVQALIWRGEIYERLTESDQALDSYAQAMNIVPNNFEARLHLARMRIQARKTPEALAEFRRLNQEQPDHPAVLLGLAACLRETGNKEEAARVLDRLLNSDPRNADALRERGRLALGSGQLEQAEGFLRRSVELDPYNAETNLHLSSCLDHVNLKRGQGLTLTAPWLFLYGWWRHLEAKAYRARCEQLKADATRLYNLFTELLNKKVTDPNVYHEIGMIFLRSGQTEEARSWFRRALRFDPLHQPSLQELTRLERQEREGS
jgi:tetratricopeptide (TPR) repeat protein